MTSVRFALRSALAGLASHARDSGFNPVAATCNPCCERTLVKVSAGERVFSILSQNDLPGRFCHSECVSLKKGAL